MTIMIKRCIRAFADLVHVVINERALSVISHVKEVFYSQWIKHEFAKCGDDNVFGGFSVLVGQKYITLGSNLYIGKDVVWEVYDNYKGQVFAPHLSFGDGCSFGDGGHITCINKIAIGNGVRMGRKVFITDNSHGNSDMTLLDTPANLRPMSSKGPVVIDDNVWIGEMTCILPGVSIGKGSIIGSNSVVTKDIPAYSMAAGNPAVVIKNLAVDKER